LVKAIPLKHLLLRYLLLTIDEDREEDNK